MAEVCTGKNDDGCVNIKVSCCPCSGSGLYDEYTVGVETITNKLYNGKRVYRKLVDCGKLPAASTPGYTVSKLVPTEIEEDVTYVFVAANYYASNDEIYVTQAYFNGISGGGTGHAVHLSHETPRRIIVGNSLPVANSRKAIAILEYTKNNEDPVKTYA